MQTKACWETVSNTCKTAVNVKKMLLKAKYDEHGPCPLHIKEKLPFTLMTKE